MTTTTTMEVPLEQFNNSFLFDSFKPQHLWTPLDALDYFSLSPFYDARSNNELVKAQQKSLEALKDFKNQGFEYQIQPTGKEPTLFVIVRQRRISVIDVSVEAIYYIHEKLLVQAPNLKVSETSAFFDILFLNAILSIGFIRFQIEKSE